ncbi:hypothetical protein QBC43DRAFT_296588 [Cladorrhinum sp. PSN259]|nr:hypothetical protein QBC43DRAFT_296588 [Cladorrhinum sp. PSN259]
MKSLSPRTSPIVAVSAHSAVRSPNQLESPPTLMRQKYQANLPFIKWTELEVAPRPIATFEPSPCILAPQPTRKRTRSASWLSSASPISHEKRLRSSPPTLTATRSSPSGMAYSLHPSSDFQARPSVTDEPALIYYSSGILDDDGDTLTDPGSWLLCQTFKNEYDPVRNQSSLAYAQDSTGSAQNHYSAPNQHTMLPPLIPPNPDYCRYFAENRELSPHPRLSSSHRSQYSPDNAHDFIGPAQNHYSAPNQHIMPPSLNPPTPDHHRYFSVKHELSPHPGPSSTRRSQSLSSTYDYRSSAMNFGYSDPPAIPSCACRFSPQHPAYTSAALPSLSASEYLELAPPKPSFDQLRNPISTFRVTRDGIDSSSTLDPRKLSWSMGQAAERLRQDGLESFYWSQWTNYYQTLYRMAHHEILEMDSERSLLRAKNDQLRRLNYRATHWHEEAYRHGSIVGTSPETTVNANSRQHHDIQYVMDRPGRSLEGYHQTRSETIPSIRELMCDDVWLFTRNSSRDASWDGSGTD